MAGLGLAVILALPALTAVYTVNYGRWAGRRGNTRGAVGLYILAALTVAAPVVALALMQGR